MAVQRPATLYRIASGLPITVRIGLVSSWQTESSSLTALPAHMDMMVAFRTDPLVGHYYTKVVADKKSSQM